MRTTGDGIIDTRGGDLEVAQYKGVTFSTTYLYLVHPEIMCSKKMDCRYHGGRETHKVSMSASTQRRSHKCYKHKIESFDFLSFRAYLPIERPRSPRKPRNRLDQAFLVMVMRLLHHTLSRGQFRKWMLGNSRGAEQ